MAAKSPTVAPYGAWVSPISPLDLAAGEHPVGGGAYAQTARGLEAWWSESRPEEGGRLAICRWGEDGAVEDVLPAPWDARTRVHEYGGGSWAIAGDRLIFANHADQRVYLLAAGGEPVALTPADAGMRFGDLACAVIGGRDVVLCVRETHLLADDGTPLPHAAVPPGARTTHRHEARDICAVPLDGSAAGDASRITSLAAGTDFLAWPRLSADGARIAWIGWDHPNMPWDATTLFVADLPGENSPAVQGEPWLTGASVIQPEWDVEALYVIGDQGGYWNLYRLEGPGAATPVAPMERELGGPAWMLGSAWYRPLGGGRILATTTLGSTRLEILGEKVFELPFTMIRLGPVAGDDVLVTCGGPAHLPGVRAVNLVTGTWRDVRLGVDGEPGPLSPARAVTFQPGEREVHAFYYPPANPGFVAPDGELPPAVAFVHGGPTSQVGGVASLEAAFFTSRGIGVLDINYGGSTGYGREYRERLRGQWGVVDVADTIAAMRGLANAGLADPARLAIRGGSAGGWTVLACVTSSDVFACGCSYYGVGDLAGMLEGTHDFESRYLESLVAPYPERADVYAERAPVNHVDQVRCPVLLLQGSDDPVVPPGQATQFADALAAKGIPHALIMFEGESHGFRRAETIRRATEAELSFYGQVMGFDPPGVPKLELVR